MILNLSGVGFAVAAIILYSIDLAITSLWWICDDDYNYEYRTLSPDEQIIREKCLEGRALVEVSVLNVISDKTWALFILQVLIMISLLFTTAISRILSRTLVMSYTDFSSRKILDMSFFCTLQTSSNALAEAWVLIQIWDFWTRCDMVLCWELCWPCT